LIFGHRRVLIAQFPLPIPYSPFPMPEHVFATAAVAAGKAAGGHSPAQCPAEESICPVVAHEWVNDEYKHLVVKATPKALAAQPGQFFHLLCPSPDEGELWFRRPQSVYRVGRSAGRLEFLYKVVGRGTKGLATLKPGDSLNMLGPLGVGFTLEPGWKNVVVLGRGVGLATMAPISQLAGERGVRVTAILSARSEELAMAADLFESVGTVIKVLDTDGSSAVENVEKILRRLIAESKADAFFTCGSNRLMQLMKRLGKEHAIPGQMAMEQIMACGLGPCYICVRTFEVNGKREMRRVCIEGPVFDLQECLGW
jgi:dihydroorotate dehydrogenase electron transfer subunit